MKRFFACMLTLVLLLLCTVGYAAELDLSYVREKTDLFTIDVEIESNAAFIESILSASTRSFVHPHESESYYSTTEFDILVIDYLDEAATYPVLRLWINYMSEEDYAYCTSVSFYLEGKEYRFSGVADADWYTKRDNTYDEKMLIKFNMENLDFLVALEAYIKDLSWDEMEAKTLKMVLHGKEDVEVELGSGFLLDFAIMKQGFVNINGLRFLEKSIGTTLKVNDVQ